MIVTSHKKICRKVCCNLSTTHAQSESHHRSVAPVLLTGCLTICCQLAEASWRLSDPTHQEWALGSLLSTVRRVPGSSRCRVKWSRWFLWGFSTLYATFMGQPMEIFQPCTQFYYLVLYLSCKFTMLLQLLTGKSDVEARDRYLFDRVVNPMKDHN